MWFNGPVTEAVSLVNTKNCVFVVYIFDDSTNSQQLDAALENETVVQKITSDAVALKMHKDSENAKLFQQLYPMPHIPILYFIRQGTIKEFGTQDSSAEEIIAKIDQAAQVVAAPSSATSSPVHPAPQPATFNSPIPQQHFVATSSSSTSNNPSSATTTNDPVNAASSSPDALAKKEKLREQMEEARKKREEKEKQDAREREMKRREDGKVMQQTKQQMEDQRNKQHFAKIKKEKKEEEEHRRKIKEQIARDRAEQIAARQAAAKKRQSESSPTTSPPVGERKSASGQQYDASSISIRQLDGSSLRNKFQATDTLAAVKDWIDQNRTDGDQPYKLLAQFPTRQFSIGDEQKSLRELDLCPSATIIMKGIKNVSHAYGGAGGNSGSYFDHVYSAGGMLYNAASAVGSTMSGVMYSLFPAEQATSSGADPTTPAVGAYPGASAASATPTTSSSATYGGQRLGGGSPRPGPRSNGSNVNTLRTSEFDDDDDGRTYNGNSLNQE
ncbi:hypothetical protein BDB00DRAFT_796052 [Zychaea mexicana]|uniref:uncharacterized protein n=1 Tax=Zychaea mexicana TaxID=64656 RepID=UPI0022FEB257|nr:uncharacterized protein BDB00DRAFT_796052 [Zychaea mexicana]KAI9499261.1 hypothetical protein BDB00DRAFT_796052 [Zychaea mexicana]